MTSIGQKSLPYKKLNSHCLLTMYKSSNFNGDLLFCRGEGGNVWQMFLDREMTLSQISRHCHLQLNSAEGI